jgi:hypothetical protein
MTASESTGSMPFERSSVRTVIRPRPENLAGWRTERQFVRNARFTRPVFLVLSS